MGIFIDGYINELDKQKVDICFYILSLLFIFYLKSKHLNSKGLYWSW